MGYIDFKVMIFDGVFRCQYSVTMWFLNKLLFYRPCMFKISTILFPLALKKYTLEKEKLSVKDKKDGHKDRKSGSEKQKQKPDGTSTSYTVTDSPVQGKKASFFQEPLNDLVVVEGMEACLICLIQDTWIHNELRPNYFICFHNDVKLNEENEYKIFKNEYGHEMRSFKTRNDNVEIMFNTQIGQLRIVMKESMEINSGNYKIKGLNNEGSYDETSGTLQVLSK